MAASVCTPNDPPLLLGGGGRGAVHPVELTDRSLVVRFKIAEGSHEYNCVRNPLLRAGFRRTRGSTWNFRWGPHLSEADYQAMNPYQVCVPVRGPAALGDMID